MRASMARQPEVGLPTRPWRRRASDENRCPARDQMATNAAEEPKTRSDGAARRASKRARSAPHTTPTSLRRRSATASASATADRASAAQSGRNRRARTRAGEPRSTCGVRRERAHVEQHDRRRAAADSDDGRARRASLAQEPAPRRRARAGRVDTRARAAVPPHERRRGRLASRASIGRAARSRREAAVHLPRRPPWLHLLEQAASGLEDAALARLRGRRLGRRRRRAADGARRRTAFAKLWRRAPTRARAGRWQAHGPRSAAAASMARQPRRRRLPPPRTPPKVPRTRTRWRRPRSTAARSARRRTPSVLVRLGVRRRRPGRAVARRSCARPTASACPKPARRDPGVARRDARGARPLEPRAFARSPRGVNPLRRARRRARDPAGGIHRPRTTSRRSGARFRRTGCGARGGARGADGRHERRTRRAFRGRGLGIDARADGGANFAAEPSERPRAAISSPSSFHRRRRRRSQTSSFSSAASRVGEDRVAEARALHAAVRERGRLRQRHGMTGLSSFSFDGPRVSSPRSSCSRTRRCVLRAFDTRIGSAGAVSVWRYSNSFNPMRSAAASLAWSAASEGLPRARSVGQRLHASAAPSAASSSLPSLRWARLRSASVRASQRARALPPAATDGSANRLPVHSYATRRSKISRGR